MRASLLAETIKSRINAGITRPTYITGTPGLGKTQIVKQIADDMGIGFMSIHAPLMQPEDLGMPVVSANRDSVKFVVPAEKFPIVEGTVPERGILLIDELPQADNGIQKTMANLMQEREIHGQYLLPGWSIVATGNNQGDRAGANRILSHLMNRMTELKFEAHLDDLCNWYMAQDKFEFRPEGMSFLRFKPSLLSDFNPNRNINATPRSWIEGVFVSMGKVPIEAELEVFTGDVGEGPAAEFVAYLKIYRALPDPDEIIKNPTKHKVPTEASVLYALSGALAQRATAENFGAIMQFVDRLPPEYSVLIVQDATKLNPEVGRTRAFIQWAQGTGKHVFYGR